MENTDKFEYVKYAIGELLIGQGYKNDALKELWAKLVINEKLQLPSLKVQETYKQHKNLFDTENNIQVDVKELGLHPEKLWKLIVFSYILAQDSLKSTLEFKIDVSCEDTIKKALLLPEEHLNQITLTYKFEKNKNIVFNLHSSHIKHMIYDLLNNISKSNTNLHTPIKRVKGEKDERALLYTFTKIMKRIISHFRNPKTGNIMRLIGRVAYIMDFDVPYSFLCGYELEAKTFKGDERTRQRLEKQGLLENNHRKTFIEIDIKLHDMIKNCAHKPNIADCGYFYDPEQLYPMVEI